MVTSGGHIQVLTIADDPAFVASTATGLERQRDRLTVHTATSPEEALGILHTQTVDCIVSDYVLSDQSGLDFLDTVRRDHPDLPFILYTADGSEDLAGEAIAAGATGYLPRKADTDQSAVLATRITDAVDQYRAESAGRETEHRLTQLTDRSPDVLWMFTADWETLLFVNAAYEDVYGQPAETLRSDARAFLDAVHPDDRAEVQAAMSRLSNGQDVDIEYRVNEAEEYQRWVWVQGAPITDDSGTVIRVAGFSRDITTRKTQENKLFRNTRAMDEAPVGITITDPTQPDNPLIYANQKFHDLTGYSESEILGQNCRFLQGEATDAAQVARMRAAIDAEERVVVELCNYRKNGAKFWNRVVIAPVRNSDGDVVNYVGFQEDITERKIREQRLTVLNRVLRHNYRNQMNIIEGYLTVLRDELGEEVEALTKIQGAVDETVDLIEGARHTESVMRAAVSRQRPVQLETRVSEIVDTAREDHPNATLSLSIPEGSSWQVASGVDDAVEEAVTNAVEHHDGDQPDVTVRVRQPDDDWVEIEIEDTGPGIPEEELMALKEGETQLTHGSHMGLWLIEWIVSQAGGTFTIPHSGADGTVLSLRIPVIA